MNGSEKKKIQELFEYRKLPFLLSYLSKKQRKKLYKKLIVLQYEIYCLDGYLEENWNLKNKKLKKYWQRIFEALADLGLSKTESFNLTADIRRYQKHEAQLRDGVMPTILNQEYYYHYKSCDVRLIRSLIGKKNPRISEQLSLEDWRYFDLITEVNDDVEDVFEDQSTINGNMFLISIIESGIGATTELYSQFIKDLVRKETESSQALGASNKAARSKLKSWTMSEAERTIKLMKKNARKVSKTGLSQEIPLVTNKALRIEN